MANLGWTDYIGAVTGIVGMVTGISGAIMGYVGYRRSNHVKALDMRLALQKDLGEARESINTLRELMASAAGSQRATLAAEDFTNQALWPSGKKRRMPTARQSKRSRLPFGVKAPTLPLYPKRSWRPS